MKTIFIVNPQAGSGKRFNEMVQSINKLLQKTKHDVEVYVTKASRDAKRFVNDYCVKHGPARFIACGGDGTLNEILNGTIDFPEAEIGVVPIGTGNDFCRNFSNHAGFLDLEKQIEGACVKCDAIKYKTFVNKTQQSGYCLNMFNVGFDCAVADMTNTIKQKTFFSGPPAYFVSIFVNLVKKKPSHLDIEVDEKSTYNGELLLTSIANGRYCGGGLKTNPIAHINDGYININIVKNISRIRFLHLLPLYIKGRYLNRKDIENIVSSRKCRKVKITSYTGNIRMTIDGEISDAGVTEFEIIPNAFNFVVPVNAFNKEKQKGECLV